MSEDSDATDELELDEELKRQVAEKIEAARLEYARAPKSHFAIIDPIPTDWGRDKELGKLGDIEDDELTTHFLLSLILFLGFCSNLVQLRGWNPLSILISLFGGVLLAGAVIRLKKFSAKVPRIGYAFEHYKVDDTSSKIFMASMMAVSVYSLFLAIVAFIMCLQTIAAGEVIASILAITALISVGFNFFTHLYLAYKLLRGVARQHIPSPNNKGS